MTFIADPEAIFEPGMIGQLVEMPDGLLVCGVSDGTKPVGIIASTKKTKTPSISFDKRKMVKVWWMRTRFKTDKFDKDGKYKKDGALYVNKNGLLTPEIPFENAYPVARLLDISASYCEALWI